MLRRRRRHLSHARADAASPAARREGHRRHRHLVDARGHAPAGRDGSGRHPEVGASGSAAPGGRGRRPDCGREGAPALLADARGDADAEVEASVAFALGQIRDPAAIAWLPRSFRPPRRFRRSPVRPQAPWARFRRPTRGRHSRSTSRRRPRHRRGAGRRGSAPLAGSRRWPQDLAPIVKWIASDDVEVRWRATWALFRPRDPAALPT